MFSFTTPIRVHYGLTDQMGVVYYGNYAQFFEIGRTEAIRSLGFTYKALEAMGVMMPVSTFQCRYLRPVLYDDLITVTVSIKDWPVRKKIVFEGTIHNEAGVLCTTSEVSLFFVEKESQRIVEMPAPLLEVLTPFFT